jgi:hypothetical protein
LTEIGYRPNVQFTPVATGSQTSLEARNARPDHTFGHSRRRDGAPDTSGSWDIAGKAAAIIVVAMKAKIRAFVFIATAREEVSTQCLRTASRRRHHHKDCSPSDAHWPPDAMATASSISPIIRKMVTGGNSGGKMVRV